MTDQRSPIENALDILVYAPVGLALTAAEELPKLAAKGRAQVQGQITIARMVGQFAVAQGRKEIEKRLGGASSRPPAPATKGNEPPEAAPARPAPAPAAPAASDSGEGSYERMSGRPDEGEAQVASDASGPAKSDGSVIDVDFGANARSVPPAEGLAIPGYDSLSASQVVQRLAGLSQDELAAVGDYEAAHRGRRTILNRVGQLKG